MVVESASSTPVLAPAKEVENDFPVHRRAHFSEPPPTIPRSDDDDQLMQDAPLS